MTQSCLPNTCTVQRILCRRQLTTEFCGATSRERRTHVHFICQPCFTNAVTLPIIKMPRGVCKWGILLSDAATCPRMLCGRNENKAVCAAHRPLQILEGRCCMKDHQPVPQLPPYALASYQYHCQQLH